MKSSVSGKFDINSRGRSRKTSCTFSRQRRAGRGWLPEHLLDEVRHGGRVAQTVGMMGPPSLIITDILPQTADKYFQSGSNTFPAADRDCRKREARDVIPGNSPSLVECRVTTRCRINASNLVGMGGGPNIRVFAPRPCRWKAVLRKPMLFVRNLYQGNPTVAPVSSWRQPRCRNAEPRLRSRFRFAADGPITATPGPRPCRAARFGTTTMHRRCLAVEL